MKIRFYHWWIYSLFYHVWGPIFVAKPLMARQFAEYLARWCDDIEEGAPK